MPTVSPRVRDVVRRVETTMQRKLQQLVDLDPYLIDLSLRENPFGSRVGQTLQDRLDILPRLREFGFRNILFGTLDYAIPDALEVDDDFMRTLHERGIDMTGGFAFTDVGLVDDGTFVPSASMLKLADYHVPNTLHEIYLSQEGMKGQYTLQELVDSLPATIAWLREHVVGDHGGPPRIIINVVDGCDAFMENMEQTCAVLEYLARLPIDGVSFEDDRGTYMPFQVGAFTEAARACLPSPLKLLVHVHTGAGYENASVIEALLAGADGAWGGLPKRAAIIGHASLGELLANLVRAGNTRVRETYAIDQLLPLATWLQTVDDPTSPIPEDLPVLGTNAYRLTLDFFRQLPTRAMDLPPEVIGGTVGYRVAPLAADSIVLAGRLNEVLGPGPFQPDVLERMIRIMRQDLRDGRRLVYDEPDELVKLYRRAGGTP